jgi:hypothetical protein
VADGSVASSIVLTLARNPGTAFVNGDRERGYVFIAPLGPDGRIDRAAFGAHRWIVRRFGDEGDGDVGWLAHRGDHWFIDYDPELAADDEPIFRLGDHRFLVGEYLTITAEGGQALTYRVAEVQPMD